MITICLLKLNETFKKKKKYKTLLIVFECVENKWHSRVNKLEMTKVVLLVYKNQNIKMGYSNR